ncbi:MAG: 30S ribosomal protein S19 [bacterium JZ-2024 1]
MGRSSKKGPYVPDYLLKKIRKAIAQKDKTPIVTWARATMITPEMVGLTFLVHNGKKHIPVVVREAMVGHRLGEFAPTRYFGGHKAKGEAKEEGGK